MEKDTQPQSINLSLEEIVRIANEIGLEYVAAKQEAERLDLLKATVKAKATEKYDNGLLTEAKLKRLSELDPEYVAHLELLSTKKGEADKLKVRYDSYRNLFEAKRSMLSYKKAEMSLV